MDKLLLVDDEPDVLQAIETTMPWEEYGICLIGTCGNALEALEQIQREPPDLVVTDIKMPVMDGIELIRRARELGCDAEFIVLSGFDEFEYAKSAMGLGVRYYLLKPCSGEELAQALKTAREECRVRRLAVSALRAAQDEGSGGERERMLPGHQADADRLAVLLEEQNDARALKVLLERECGESGCQAALVAGMKVLLKRGGNSAQLTEVFNRLYESGETEEFVAFLSGALADSAGEKPPARQHFVEEILCYVDSHLEDDRLSLKWVSAELVYRNEDYVGRAFSAYTGENFLSYLNRRRMERAKFLISTLGDDRLYTVAEQIGLGHNPRYFSKLFKKYTGATPKEYRKRFQRRAE